MTFNVIMSNGYIHKIVANDAREAFGKAQKEFGFGTFVKEIVGYGSDDFYYAGGNFLNPVDVRKEEILATDIDTILASCLHLPVMNRQAECIINGRYYKRTLTRNNDTIDCIVFDHSTDIELAKYKISITIEAVAQKAHKFENRICTGCNQSLFDVDNPNGICEG